MEDKDVNPAEPKAPETAADATPPAAEPAAAQAPAATPAPTAASETPNAAASAATVSSASSKTSAAGDSPPKAKDGETPAAVATAPGFFGRLGSRARLGLGAAAVGVVLIVAGVCVDFRGAAPDAESGDDAPRSGPSESAAPIARPRTTDGAGPVDLLSDLSEGGLLSSESRPASRPSADETPPAPSVAPSVAPTVAPSAPATTDVASRPAVASRLAILDEIDAAMKMGAYAAARARCLAFLADPGEAETTAALGAVFRRLALAETSLRHSESGFDASGIPEAPIDFGESGR